jgi:protein involved in polysaccharide export with SLBB domain
MKLILISSILICLLGSPLFAQHEAFEERAVENSADILRKQAQSNSDQPGVSQIINQRTHSAPRGPKLNQEYLLGPGDKIEITVEGIPGLDKKEFDLDSQGNIFVPYLGQVTIMGLSVREVESKLIRMFAVSLLEDPQVTVGIKEYKSRYFYVMGSVHKPGKYPLIQSTDILDALAIAGGLTDKADPKIRIYRYSPAGETSGGSGVDSPSNPVLADPLVFSMSDLLEGDQDVQRFAILSGDVIAVQERKDRPYYVLGDILKPGAYTMPPEKGIALSQALANAGGILKTASGKKMVIIRRKANEELPEQIPIDAYALLKGKIPDIELLEDDIVLVPGSASKTLGKNFLSGVSGLLTALLVVGLP